VPLIAHNSHNTSVILPGETAQTAAEHMTNLQIVRENYFTTLEIPLLRGRIFDQRDNGQSQKVAVVSQEFARRYFPDDDPIGKRIRIDDNSPVEIELIGVVGDTKYNSQREEIEPLLYRSWLQESKSIGQMNFMVRAAGEPTALASAARQAVREVDSNLPVIDVTTQEAQSSRSLTDERLFASLLSFFGGLALLLAAIGLYGVMAYSVAQRTGEIGIRMALGARPGDVLRLVIRQGMWLVITGLVVGAAGALALTRVIASQLYGVQATDPMTFVMVGALLLGIALLACWIPARRAARVDPMVALRYE
jgi:putative ABC transport system permease protein